MVNSSSADVIVIGLGAFGSATAYQLARRGAKVIGIDQFAPPHDRGSSHGATRITRMAVGEGEVYVPLVRRTHEIWKALESAYGQALYIPTGGIIMGPRDGRVRHHGKPNFVQRTIESAQRFDIPHEVLDAKQIAERFPQFLVRGDELGYYEPDSGVLRPEQCVGVQIEAARHHGATIRLNEKVLSIESTATGATVRTSAGTCTAGKVIVTAGPWVPGMVGGDYAKHLKVLRQVLYWFKSSEPQLYGAPHCPVFIWMHGEGDEDYLYGFPMVDGYNGVKVATEQYRKPSDPDGYDRTVSDDERRKMFKTNVEGRLRGVSGETVHSAACLYTVSTDSSFVVDRHPRLENVTVVSACSGHGFKHSAALGEALAQQSLGQAVDQKLEAFSLGRF